MSVTIDVPTPIDELASEHEVIQQVVAGLAVLEERLRAGGLVVTKENPVDGRRLLYTLAPAVQVRQTEAGGRELDFGPCVVRL